MIICTSAIKILTTDLGMIYKIIQMYQILYTRVQRENTILFVSVTVCNILSKCIVHVSYSKVIVRVPFFNIY